MRGRYGGGSRGRIPSMAWSSAESSPGTMLPETGSGSKYRPWNAGALRGPVRTGAANNGTAALGLGHDRDWWPSLPQLKQAEGLQAGSRGGSGSGVLSSREYRGAGSAAASEALASPCQSTQYAWQ
eukprot:scaffold29803_cov107-Isochrysis_galbana.AAC.4